MKQSICYLVFLLLCGCESVVKYPPYGQWTKETKSLGIIKADSGRWPLSLNSLPHEQTFYSALLDNAASTFQVNRNEIVLGEVTVQVGAEMVGTIRDWKATAEAGQNKPTSATPLSIAPRSSLPAWAPQHLAPSEFSEMIYAAQGAIVTFLKSPNPLTFPNPETQKKEYRFFKIDDSTRSITGWVESEPAPGQRTRREWMVDLRLISGKWQPDNVSLTSQ